MQASAEMGESFWLKRLADGADFSCELGSGAGQALETFWRDVFSTTRPGSRVLEIGCGAGHVSVWAAEAGRQFEVIASDIHDHREAAPLHPDVAFLGAARAEALPLATRSVDMVVSNFAFEYTPAPLLAACELVRVLRPGGAATLVIHSADSAITANGRHLLETSRKLIEADLPGRIRRAAALRADHLSRRKLLKDALKMRGLIPDGEAYFRIAERLLRNDPKARQDYEALEETAERLAQISQAQMRAALDDRALLWLKNQFAGLGMDVYTTEIAGTWGGMDRQKFGWLMFLTKPFHTPAHVSAY